MVWKDSHHCTLPNMKDIPLEYPPPHEYWACDVCGLKWNPYLYYYDKEIVIGYTKWRKTPIAKVVSEPAG